MKTLLWIAAIIATWTLGLALGHAALAGAGTNIHPGAACPTPSSTYVRVDRYLFIPTDPTFDACMEQLRSSGKRVIVTVVGDTNPATYAASLAAMARKWPGTTWEIWNEQNHAYFWQGTQAEYMALLKAAAPAIHAADPYATVLLGGLAWRGTTAGLGSADESAHAWLRRAYRMGLRGLVDGVAVHPYTPVGVWPQAFDNLRRIQWRYRDPVPLWLTEFGEWGMTWPQAQKIATDALERYPFVQAAVWYDLDGLGV